MRIRAATTEDHDEIVRIGKTSPYTRDVSNRMMFTSDAAYEKGWIRVAEEDDRVVGFTCVRHKVRHPETMLYFITVDPDARSSGVGVALMQDLEEQSPHRCIRLNVMQDNEGAIRFYERLGFRKVGVALGELADSMEKTW